MQADIHPSYSKRHFTCSCGNKIEVGSTLSKDFSIEVCSNCHPFYTGRQKIVDTAGRVERFQKRFRRTLKTQEEPENSENKE